MEIQAITIIFVGVFVSAVFAQPKLQTFAFPKSLTLGKSVRVFCNPLDHEGKLTFKWLKDGKELRSSQEGLQINIQETYSMLEIRLIKWEDVGNYTCVAEDEKGQGSVSATLEIKVPPSWFKEPFNADVKVKDKLFVHCVANGFPTPKITWSKVKENSNSILVETTISQTVSENGSLTFHSFKLEEAGEYVCNADNGVGNALTKTIKVSVLVPARFEEKFVVLTTKRGESAKLECNALGDQPLTVTWRKEKKQLSKLDSNRYEIFETLTKEGVASELVIRSTERDDGAMYTCLAENEFGKDERRIRVLVLEVPAPPLDVRVREVWTRSAGVSWSTPYSGNSPIVKYIVQYWRDLGAPHRLNEMNASNSQMTAMIKDLHPGTSYVVKIVAENEVGRGTQSDPVSLKTGEEEPTAPPVDITVEPKGPSTIRVTWKPPPKDHWNGQLKGYYVGYKARDSSQPYSYKSVEYSADVMQEYFLSNLARGTEYNVVVKAHNSAGSGPASHEAIARTSDGDLPPPPTVFVTSTTTNSITLRWNIKHDAPAATGYNVHFREDGGSWQELTILKPEDSSYSLNGLRSGTLYQVYLTGTTSLGRGDPSDVIAVKTEGGTDQAGAEVDKKPLHLDLSILIPVVASLVATIVVVIVACLCVHKIRQRQNLERAIAEQQLAYKGTMQRYVDMEKARLSHPNEGTSQNPNHYPLPYSTLQMREMLMEETSSKEDDPEIKAFIPQDPRDRPLPFPRPNSLKKRESNVYDSPQ